MLPPAPTSAHSTTASLAQHPLTLAVMNAEECGRFFPEGLWLDGATIPLVSPTTTGELTAWCVDLRPRVLLCSWSTPALAASILKSGGGSVEYVCNITGSVRHLVNREMIAAGLQVSNWGQMIAPQVAEHALLLILGALRNVPRWRSIFQSGELGGRPVLQTRSLFGKKIGLHGFGSIARELVRLLAPFSVEIEVYSEGVPEDFLGKFGVSVAPSLVELARDKDVFVCCEALTERTLKSVDRTVLSALRDGAVFCNVGRGAVVDEVVLAELAGAKQLRVASDVFAEEPLAVDSPLLAHPLALLSPHIGGPTQDSFANCGRYALENLRRFGRDEAIESLVSLAVFDRST